MNREKVFRQIVKLHNEADQWIDKVPSDINAAFFDNTYVNALRMQIDLLMTACFGEYTESVEWFLHEWKPGYEVGFEGHTVPINSLDEYIEWMKVNEGFE